MADQITVHKLLSHQVPIGESAARFKVVRAGRRFGKDALAENVSLLGHGPDKCWKGLIHGKDVVWMAPTIPQAAALWKNEVEPRFRNIDTVSINKVEKTVTICNPDGSAYATLWVRSAEAVDSVRGIGKRLGGVVINEAAWMDLEYVWRDVLRPTLMDCGGWALIMSTTNGGPDGHVTEEGKRSPSFFNILCDEIQSGLRGPEWAEFYGTARDNPKIRPEEFNALVSEYPSPDDTTCQQEVFANLIVGGAGVAFPEWDEKVHVADYRPPMDWAPALGGDYGYDKPGWYGLFVSGPERALCIQEWYIRQTDPEQVGYEIGMTIRKKGLPIPEWGSIDTPPVADGGPSLLERIQAGVMRALGEQAFPLVNPPKGPGSRITKKMEIHRLLKWERPEKGEDPKPWKMPKLQFSKDCIHAIRTLARLPRDPKGKEDVDTDAEDHPYDGIAAWAMFRPRVPDMPKIKIVEQDTHPGFEKTGAGWERKGSTDYAPAPGRYNRHQEYVHAVE